MENNLKDQCCRTCYFGKFVCDSFINSYTCRKRSPEYNGFPKVEEWDWCGDWRENK